MIRHSCPDCQHLLHTAEVLAGMAVACPHCRSGVRVPRSGSAVLARETSSAQSYLKSKDVSAKALEGGHSRWLTGRRVLVLGLPILVGIGVLLFLGYYYFFATPV